MHDQKFFIPDPAFEHEGFDVMTILGKNQTLGDIGIEIECEGNKFPKADDLLPEKWRYTHDGSLRGKDNAEYVLKTPIAFGKAPEAVTEIFDCLKAYGTILDESNRTSVHVHLNVQSFYLPRLTTFLALYFSLEEILTEWCGDHRVGNLFCLRAKDAPAIVSKIKKWIVNDGRTELTEGLHYSGMNAQALVKFGSLEIRSLRGVTEAKDVIAWIGVLQRLYDLSAEYPDPRNVTDNFSGGGPIEFMKTILGSHYSVVRDAVPMTDSQVETSMYEGIRLAQDLCYCRDWSRYTPVTRSKNPFGRNKKQTISDYINSLASSNPASAVGLANSYMVQSQSLGNLSVPMPFAPYPAPEPGIVSYTESEDEAEDHYESDDGFHDLNPFDDQDF